MDFRNSPSPNHAPNWPQILHGVHLTHLVPIGPALTSWLGQLGQQNHNPWDCSFDQCMDAMVEAPKPCMAPYGLHAWHATPLFRKWQKMPHAIHLPTHQCMLTLLSLLHLFIISHETTCAYFNHLLDLIQTEPHLLLLLRRRRRAPATPKPHVGSSTGRSDRWKSSQACVHLSSGLDLRYLVVLIF